MLLCGGWADGARRSSFRILRFVELFFRVSIVSIFRLCYNTDNGRKTPVHSAGAQRHEFSQPKGE